MFTTVSAKPWYVPLIGLACISDRPPRAQVASIEYSSYDALEQGNTALIRLRVASEITGCDVYGKIFRPLACSVDQLYHVTVVL